jgi:hypothetical protein
MWRRFASRIAAGVHRPMTTRAACTANKAGKAALKQLLVKLNA